MRPCPVCGRIISLRDTIEIKFISFIVLDVYKRTVSVQSSQESQAGQQSQLVKPYNQTISWSDLIPFVASEYDFTIYIFKFLS